MARPTHISSTGKGERDHGRKHLNASLPRQLVFDFNAVAKREGHGRRDAIVEGLLRRFLETVDPTCESLQQPPSNSFVEHVRAAGFSKREASRLADQVATQQAIRIARDHALEIVEATSAFVTRKAPKRAERQQSRKEKAS